MCTVAPEKRIESSYGAKDHCSQEKLGRGGLWASMRNPQLTGRRRWSGLCTVMAALHGICLHWCRYRSHARTRCRRGNTLGPRFSFSHFFATIVGALQYQEQKSNETYWRRPGSADVEKSHFSCNHVRRRGLLCEICLCR